MNKKWLKSLLIYLVLAVTLPQLSAQQPWRIYSLFSYDAYESEGILTIDESISIPLINNFVISTGVAWKGTLIDPFFTDPAKAEARLGIIYIQPSWSMYFELYGGSIWVPQTMGTPLWEAFVQTTLIEAAVNWETDLLYFGLRERILFNTISTTSITNFLFFWTPQRFFKLSLGMSIGIENDVPTLPGIRAEFIAPIIKSVPELFRAGLGITYERFFDDATLTAGNTITIKAILASAPLAALDIKAGIAWNFGDKAVYPLQLEMLSAIVLQ
ncbi:MAG TPA: hypothetical protein P5519_11150 [Spirochaetia bacterium]|nr:hypothetical protein [Spirochaetales bacterium]HRS66428.1 hypothetical protein [Spirochaetia bacterium]HOT58536.1 hypothetical protein [Spirochaetales bacterium]HPD80360.1 hypothetical protein [Spirochaetales bacterium]HQK35030.1 hypothetical protein [Spirochaetales bacterium]